MTSHHDARCKSFTALNYHYFTSQHRPRRQNYIFPILATVSKPRRILNHSRTAISTSSLWNRQPPGCSPIFQNQFLRCFCVQILLRRVEPTSAIVIIDLRLNIFDLAAPFRDITTYRRGKHSSLLKAKSNRPSSLRYRSPCS